MSSAPALIFVDDEPAILRSARRVLHRVCSGWELHFCETLDQATAAVGQSEVWILILDEKSLGDDLSHAQELFSRAPAALRVILTSSSDESVIYGSTRIAHMVLPKPFQKQDLEGAVTRALAIAELQMSDRLRSSVAQLQSLPVLPEVYRRVSSELSEEDPDVDRVASVISDQPQVLARLLQVSNSALFGFTTPSKDTRQVVMRLGLDMVKHLVLFSGLFSSDTENEHSDQIAEFANEAQVFAGKMQQLAELAQLDSKLKSEAWVAGLMHNIGKLVVLHCRDAGAEASKQPAVAYPEYETASALLMMLWGFDLDTARALELQNATQLTAKATDLLQLVNATHRIMRKDNTALEDIENEQIRDACKQLLQG